jgi:hypothetical protein
MFYACHKLSSTYIKGLLAVRNKEPISTLSVSWKKGTIAGQKKSHRKLRKRKRDGNIAINSEIRVVNL